LHIALIYWKQSACVVEAVTKQDDMKYDSRFPATEDLRQGARRRMPRFAFEYLDGGCNEDVNLYKNTAELRKVELKPYYLSRHTASSTQTELFGKTYDAPFGVAPVGLQGLMWPNSPEILAKAAFAHNIPFILSTVTTSSIERIGELTEGRFWFQLYHPAKDELRDDILRRAESAGCEVLVILCDVPTFGYRPRDIRNGLAMPPRMSLRNMLQILGRPRWALQTLRHGQPNFATMKRYMPKGLDIKQLGLYMNETFSGRLNEEKIKAIRGKWKGKLVLKGVASEEDTEMAIRLGLDGIIVSNHGGRQLDAGESSISPLTRIARAYGDQLTVMIYGVWRSPVSAPALGAGGRRFESCHPDTRAFLHNTSTPARSDSGQSPPCLADH
jgi:L-lactate dehydrogenase (cytochrome)